MKMGKSYGRKQAGIGGGSSLEGLRLIVEKFGDIFHEWQTEQAAEFFRVSGISCRNWRIFMRREGLADGVKWTLRALADEEGISHIRVMQIANQTRKNLARHLRSAVSADS